jgi:hypothetical protein
MDQRGGRWCRIRSKIYTGDEHDEEMTLRLTKKRQ